ISFNLHKKIIYEIYDIKGMNNLFLNKIREQIEKKIILKNVNGMVVATPFFKKYYENLNIKHINIVVINNKPNKNSINKNIIDKYKKLQYNKVLTIGYIGTVRSINILINLIDSVKEIEKMRLVIAGDGPSKKEIQKYIKSNNLNDT